MEFNQLLREEAASRGHVYVDLHAAFSDGRGQLRRERSNDGLHLLGAVCIVAGSDRCADT